MTEDPVIADHMALFLALNTQRPNIGITKRKYNIHSITLGERAGRNEKLQNKPENREMLTGLRARSTPVKPMGLHQGIRRLLQRAFKDRYTKQKMRTEGKPPRTSSPKTERAEK